MFMNFSKDCKIVNLNSVTGSSAGSTTFFASNGGVDTKGYDGVSIIATLGAVLATGKAVLVPCWSDTTAATTGSSGSSDYCAGFDSGTTEHANTLLVVDYPDGLPARYVSAKLVKGTANVTCLGMTAILYNKHGAVPVTNEVAGSSGNGQYLVSDLVCMANAT